MTLTKISKSIYLFTYVFFYYKQFAIASIDEGWGGVWAPGSFGKPPAPIFVLQK